jgi:hypothetical protein|tara:strand:- start:1022 stop:1459 length:438 start_codon:yes stop_codon:yes gene_type:complete
MFTFKQIDTPLEKMWAKNRTRAIICEDTQGIIAYDNQKFAACALFDSFTVESCNVHLAIINPFVLRHGFLNAVCDHVFDVCKRERIFGLVPSDNRKALKFNKHIGMTEMHTIKDAIKKDVHYVVMQMNKKDCVWRSNPATNKEAA